VGKGGIVRIDPHASARRSAWLAAQPAGTCSASRRARSSADGSKEFLIVGRRTRDEKRRGVIVGFEANAELAPFEGTLGDLCTLHYMQRVKSVRRAALSQAVALLT
jgi:hypothetical protein